MPSAEANVGTSITVVAELPDPGFVVEWQLPADQVLVPARGDGPWNGGGGPEPHGPAS